MDENLENIAKREMERASTIVRRLVVLDREKASSLVSVLMSYLRDCEGFYRDGKWLQCIESAFICWAYVDAGLHLGVFSVPDDMRDIFTV
jgi:hypothetical protein